MSVVPTSTADARPTSLTIFTTPKKFDGHIGVIQRNAVASWTRMSPRPEVILFGTEPGTAEAAAEFGLRHISGVNRALIRASPSSLKGLGLPRLTSVNLSASVKNFLSLASCSMRILRGERTKTGQVSGRHRLAGHQHVDWLKGTS